MDIVTEDMECTCDDDSDEGNVHVESNQDVDEESNDNSSCDSDLDTQQDDRTSHSLLHWILVIFFRIIYHFNISNNAASALLSFISLVLGKTLIRIAI